MGPKGKERWGGKKTISNWTSNNRSHFVWSGESTEKQGLVWNHNKLDLAGMGQNERRSGWRRREEGGKGIDGIEWRQSKRWDYIGEAIITLPHLACSQERTWGFSIHLAIYTQTHTNVQTCISHGDTHLHVSVCVCVWVGWRGWSWQKNWEKIIYIELVENKKKEN